MKRTVAAGASALLLLVTLACGQQTWDAAMQAGETALQRGQYEQAEKIFSAAVHKAEEFGLHDRRVAVTLAHLAQAYSAQGKFVEAEPVYLEALKIYQDVHGENHLDVAAMLNNLGVLHRKHGQYADAQRLLTRALSIKEKLLGTDHPEVALALSNLAAMYRRPIAAAIGAERSTCVSKRSFSTAACGSKNQRSSSRLSAAAALYPAR